MNSQISNGWDIFVAEVTKDPAGWREAILEVCSELQEEQKPKRQYKPLDGEVTIADIKRALPLLDLIKQYIPVVVRGTRGYAKCPWHKDNRPSLVIDLEKNLYHCFAGCSSGDIFNWLMKMEGLEFKEAFEVLKKIA